MLTKRAEEDGKSLPALIGLNVHTFKGYLKRTRQDNLWPLLPAIMAAFPEISRDWLYFDEGKMFRSDGDVAVVADNAEVDAQRVADLEKTVAALETALAAKDELLAQYRKK